MFLWILNDFDQTNALPLINIVNYYKDPSFAIKQFNH